MLVVTETHPIQYHAPVFRFLQKELGIPVTVIYGSDFSVREYLDVEFGERFAWDTDLLSGYQSVFLSRVSEGGARKVKEVSPRGLTELLRQISPEALLVAGYGHAFHRSALLAGWRQKVPMLFRAETNDEDRERGLAKRIARDAGLRSLYRRCERLLYIGERSRSHFQRLGVSDDKLVFSPYCIDASSFETDEAARGRLRSPTRELLGIGPQQNAILFSGKLSSRKGPDLLLRAVKAIEPGLRAKITVIFLGNGEMKQALARLAQAEPCVNVVFAGFKNQSELSPYYHAADMLVLPSRHSETWGLVVNEALHHGLPCVVSSVVGCGSDLIASGMSGEVFETDSVDSLASAINHALELVEQPGIRERCRTKVAAYSVDRAARGIAEAYHSVAPQTDYALA